MTELNQARDIDVKRVASELHLRYDQVQHTVQLLDEGNTVPFITRYRKERTGNLHEEQIRAIQERVISLRHLAERAGDILRLIEAQGKLTPGLKSEIEQADSLKRLDDLYLPFRPKRRSRATMAKERGLEPLADSIWNQSTSGQTLESVGAKYIRPENEVPDANKALEGAADIIAERIGDDANLRELCRAVARETGQLKSFGTKSADQSHPEFRDYFEYAEPISKIPPHRILALNRGEEQKALRVTFTWNDERATRVTCDHLELDRHRHREFMSACASDALERFVQPALDREFRRDLTEKAERHAISVFAQNLRNLLLQPPLHSQRVLAIDPGFRTGCKLAVLDEVGSVVVVDVMYILSDEKKGEAKTKLVTLIREHGCQVIVIGNGTACRETEELVTEMIASECPEVQYIVVNEAGASIYSTSSVAQQEFPQLDAIARGTISIGRRLQDPLSELVKIEPQHIGVGMYQHDLNLKQLKDALDQVVESCVNYVGVDINRASSSLLAHVSGFNQLLARRVVEYRDKQGSFTNRQQLLNVPGIGPATFTQAAGFLKLDGDEPFDNTWIHPESYDIARKLLNRCSLTPEDVRPSADRSVLKERLSDVVAARLADELGCGIPTLEDILDDLQRPGRDPRADLPPPVFRKGVLSLSDIEVGMELQGTVLNVVDFGAFVDVGLKDSALVHISQLATHFVKSPHDIVSIGDVIKVWVLSVDRDRKRVGLTMIPPGASESASAPKPLPVRADTSSPAPVAAKPKSSNVAPKPKQPGMLKGFDELKQQWKTSRE
ncbi:Tex family protein [Schlesneria paludicola]|uniref:Tex family protein n=1 Tax=Schlesneria paludicola TaxID=360056 RepID=UPI00029B4EC5|nr:Tex family protein [Schlesneria paludicola]